MQSVPASWEHASGVSAERVSQIDTTVAIVTPENIAFTYQLAGPFRRLGAYVLDMTTMFAILFLLLLGWHLVALPALVWLLGQADMTELAETAEYVFLAFYLVTWFVMYWFYGGLFETFMNGQTPGKWAMGIRVLCTDGRPINALQAILRNILRLADSFPLLSPAIFAGTFIGDIIELIIGGGQGQSVSIESLGAWTVLPTYTVGLLAALLSRRFQRLGDLACGTMVVLEERRPLAGITPLDDPGAKQLAASIPPTFQAGPGLARALATYVERRKRLSPARRAEVARHLGLPLLARFGLSPNTSCDLLLCALYYRTFLADRGQQQAKPLVSEQVEGSNDQLVTAATPAGEAPPAGSTAAPRPGQKGMEP